MSIKRTAPTSSGSSGGGSFWTSFAAWTGLVVSMANLALLMLIWNRLPVDDLRQTLSFVTSKDPVGAQADAGDEAADGGERAARPADAPTSAVLDADTLRPVSRPAPVEENTTAQAATENERPKIRVQVLNASGVRLMAAKAADGLRRLRYDVRETGNAGESLEKTRIVSRLKAPAFSMRLAQDLGLSSARITYEEDPNLVDVDITLILGADQDQLPIMKQVRTTP